MIEPGDSMQWWVDSSYTIHPDMNSSYGIVMTLGKESHTPHHANRNQTEKPRTLRAKTPDVTNAVVEMPDSFSFGMNKLTKKPSTGSPIKTLRNCSIAN